MRYVVTYKAKSTRGMIEMTALQTEDLAEALECAQDADSSGCRKVELFDRDTMQAVNFKKGAA